MSYKPEDLAETARPDPDLVSRVVDIIDDDVPPFVIADRVLAALRDAGWAESAEVERLRAERVVSVVFSHAKDAPRPFALYRDQDATGVSGTGVVAQGAEWPDGLVVLRWTGAWPTSVVFHDRGIESVEAIHGHGGKTRVVWLSEELEPLAAMEQERDAARAEVAAVQRVVDAARAYEAAWNEYSSTAAGADWPATRIAKAQAHQRLLDAVRAVDALPAREAGDPDEAAALTEALTQAGTATERRRAAAVGRCGLCLQGLHEECGRVRPCGCSDAGHPEDGTDG